MIKIISSTETSSGSITAFCSNNPGTQEGRSPPSSQSLSSFGNAQTRLVSHNGGRGGGEEVGRGQAVVVR